jgi:putative heme-binding domain-containing protein
VWAFDHLFVNVTGKGIFRLRDGDGNGDSQLNIMEYLGGPSNPSEHGNHTVVKTPDGEGLYYVAGNFVPPPPELAVNTLSGWEEDLLLPREWDARGHARGIMAPGGWIARINPDATEWKMVSIGYRNQYDIAINQYGEIFTFDADMEWDMGMPWYRPTRIIHVVSGSDYGWRSGTGKWPEYFEDSLPPALNVGPGSPTGVVFGTNAKFPAKYQHAMFALDWTFGTIYAVHFTPDGSSYKAEVEEFLTGAPLPVTGAVIGNDGALYFLTGGRKQDSQFYRVVYRGDESTEPAEPSDPPEALEARELRHNLESFHGRRHPDAVDTAWPYLSNEDRFIRNAARVAIEAQPTESWSERALNEQDPQARITSLVALARTGSENHRSDAIQSLLGLDIETLTTDQKLGMLRAMSLVFMRLGDPDETERSAIISEFHRLLPDSDDRVNTELIRNLIYLRDSQVAEKAIALIRDRQPPEAPNWSESLLERNEEFGGVIQEMIGNPPPTRELEYVFMLRTLREGWNIDLRREYFTFINEAADRQGGSSYSGFLEDLRTEALRNSTVEEREAVADITGISLAQAPDFSLVAPEGPGREWSVNEAVETVDGQLKGRDFERGRNAFFVTSCAACHRFDIYGGDSAPDLTNVSNRISTTRLIEKIIEPNNLISDQYSSSEITLKSGETYTGLPVETGDMVTIYPRNPNLDPVEVARNEIDSIRQLDISQMPENLVNSLNEDELRDLIAYLQSGGDPDHEVFQTEKGEEDEEEPNVQ